ncbi:hypothetical protein C0989_007722, partial [Termitomyces sp. Mn162]
ANIGRVTLGRELATIKDYRQRLNQYRTDDSLACAHQHNPWITDDHENSSSEVADNAWKAGTTNSNDTEIGCSFSDSGACFTDRKLAAIRAYHEWMPIRQVTADDKLRIWRNFQIGKLLDLTMLDTRELIIDAWDGYRKNRARVFDHLSNRSISNTVILSGDSHDNWVSDLAPSYDEVTGNGAFGVEFGGTAVTSPSSFGTNISPTDADVISRGFVAQNPELQWSEGSFRGFFTLTVDPETLNATFYGMKNISTYFSQLTWLF